MAIHGETMNLKLFEEVLNCSIREKGTDEEHTSKLRIRIAEKEQNSCFEIAESES